MDSYPETNSTFFDLPDTLKWLRKMRGMTLQQASDSTGLSVSFLSEMERSITNPSLKTLQRLVECYQSPLSVQLYVSQRA